MWPDPAPPRTPRTPDDARQLLRLSIAALSDEAALELLAFFEHWQAYLHQREREARHGM